MCKENNFLDFVLILDLGLSRGEILGLKWGDVDFEANAVKINRLFVARNGVTCIADPENKREFAMMKITAKLLANRKSNRGNDEFIIPSPSNATAPFNPSAYRKKIAKVTSKALDGESVTIELLGSVLTLSSSFSRDSRCSNDRRNRNGTLQV